MAKDNTVVTFKESVKLTWWAFMINMGVSKFSTLAQLFILIYRSLEAFLNTYVLAKVIDVLINQTLLRATRLDALIPYIALLIGIQIISILVGSLDNYVRWTLRRRVDYKLAIMEYTHKNYIGIQTLQLPDVANRAQRAQEWLPQITQLLNSFFRVVASGIRGVVASIVVFSFSWVVGLGIVLSAILFFIQDSYYTRRYFKLDSDEEITSKRRSANASKFFLQDSNAIDEISLYGSFGYLDNHYKSVTGGHLQALEAILKKNKIAEVLAGFFNAGILAYGVVLTFSNVLSGAISVGQTTFFISSINTFYGGLASTLSEFVTYRDYLMKLKEVYAFYKIKPIIVGGNIKLERLIKPPYLEFRNVSFKYPSTKRYIFKNFNLRIESGEKVALVGENGAGKTTLVKLLCRFYDPNEGDIFINGINLKDLDLDDWYKNVGVLFQEFNFYGNLTVKENIFLGRSVKKIDEQRIIESSKNADAYEFIQNYEKGFNTPMNERFKGGIRPSKGQKQKIAIARFFYRDAPLAIFDEPTASIDADAEYRIFNRIYNFFDNKTVIIISHRFSTVRNADRIIVIKNGEVQEKGSHRELLELKGVYLDNFRKQAEGYV